MTEFAPCLDEAQRFLELLDPDAEKFTFQTFDDDETLKRKYLAGVAHGSLDNEASRLTNWSKRGAGVFVTVNETDGLGRKTESITRVRAVFADLDGAPLEPVMACALTPHVVVESSPGRWHAYWPVDGLPLEQFKPVQQAIVARFGGDAACCDLARVMRLPGFVHQKGEPFVTRIQAVNELLPYTAAEILAEFPPVARKANGAANGQDHGSDREMDELTRRISTGEEYHAALRDLAFRYAMAGMPGASITLVLRGLMNGSTGPRDERWHARYAQIPELVRTAEEKLKSQGHHPNGTNGVNGTNGTDASSDDGWPEPDMTILSEHRLPAPALPLQVFGQYWAEWIVRQAEAKSCPADYVGAALLSGASVLIGNARWGSPWESWTEPPILWTASVGNPSSGKSPAACDLMSMIEADANAELEEKLAAWNTANRAARIHLELWEQATKAALKKGAPPPEMPVAAVAPERPTRKRIVTSDTTIEKAARILIENTKGLLLKRDELAGWIGSLERYGSNGSDRAFYLESYGGRPYVVDRVKDPEPIVVPALTIAITGGIQPDRLNTLVLNGDDDGLAARFLYVWPERVPPRRPQKAPPTGAKTKLAMLRDLEERDDKGARVAIPFMPAAAAVIQNWRELVAGGETGLAGLFLSWSGKLPGFAVRLATVLEHLYWCGDREGLTPPPQAISERAAASAVVFLEDYATSMARRCFGEAALPQQDRDAIALARWIMTQASVPELLNERDLRRRTSALEAKDPKRYEAALKELAEVGWVRSAPARAGGTDGRQKKNWAVNPKLRRPA